MNNELLEIMDNVETPLFILEPSAEGEPHYVFINQFFSNNTKLTLDDVRGKTAAELYPDRFGQFAYENHCECLNIGKKSKYELTVQINNSSRHIETTLAPMLDKTGRVYRIIGTTKAANADHSIREAHANTLTLNTEIEQLISLSAHDLRSPMRNMKTLTELLRKDFIDLGDGKIELIELLERVSVSTVAMIGNIIDYTQTVNSAESVECFELASVCRDIMSMLDPANTHDLQVEKTALHGDKIATQVVLRNLLDNAIKHNKDKVLRLTIKASSTAEQNYEVIVRDNGKGVQDPSTLFKEGTPVKIDEGFGLYAVIRLVKARGGAISAAHAPSSSGLEVKFRLPGALVHH